VLDTNAVQGDLNGVEALGLPVPRGRVGKVSKVEPEYARRAVSLKDNVVELDLIQGGIGREELSDELVPIDRVKPCHGYLSYS